jgi:hypothetical protein
MNLQCHKLVIPAIENRRTPMAGHSLGAYPPVDGGNVVGRLHSDRPSIAKGKVSVREQRFGAKQLL